MAFGLGRGLSTPLMVINFILYLIAAALAGWALNRNIDSASGTAGYVGNTLKRAISWLVLFWQLKFVSESAPNLSVLSTSFRGGTVQSVKVGRVCVVKQESCIERLLLFVAAGNGVTQWFLPIALIASVVGLASVLTGVHHVRVYRNDSLAAAHAASLIAWLLTLLAMGWGSLLCSCTLMCICHNLSCKFGTETSELLRP